MNWSKAIILFKFPSRERPEKFRQALLSILENSNQVDRIKFIITIDSNDPTLAQYHKVIDEVLSTSKVMEYIVTEGESKSKIDAVNKDLDQATDFQILCCMSDDMRFIVKGYDDTIRNDFSLCFPNGDGCIHYPDQHQGERCMTLNVTDRIYFERFRYIYHPDYESVECDLENQEVAQMLGKYRFVDKRIVNHLHPSFGDTGYDSLYNRTEDQTVHNKDKATRKRRLANNYDLIKTENGWIQPNDKPIVKMAEIITGDNGLNDLIERAEKSKKLKWKLDRKMAVCRELANEITALGLVKVEVNVVEEAVK